MVRAKNAIPDRGEQWVREISAAYADAREAIPFGDLLGTPFDEGDLFHLAPMVALKFRGLPRTQAKIRRVTEAALASYVANRGEHEATLNDPRLSFAFCYLASHFGLGLLSVPDLEAIMQHVEENEAELVRLIEDAASP